MISRAGAGAVPAKFHIVGNGRDPSVFHPHTSEQRRAVREHLGISEDAPLLGYAGSVGPQYMFPQMLELLTILRARDSAARLLILTASVQAAGQAILDFAPGQANACHLATADPQEVSAYLAACDVGLALRRASFSMQGVAPIKIGEYLLSGLPVIGSEGIGDVAAPVSQGVFLPFDGEQAGLEAAAEWVLQVRSDREAKRAISRQCGIDNFSLGQSADQYRAGLLSIAGQG